MSQSGLYDGVLLVDKPTGPTSHDVVALIRRRFRFDKVGHGGTLDPQASGLLVLLIERGTKLSNLFLNADKAYEGAMKLGVSTDTQDTAGKIIQERDPGHVTQDMLLAAMKKFSGDIMQTPPMVSAAKKDGVCLYKLARKGQVVEREPKLIHVRKFILKDFALPVAHFSLECTKGTYVRTLCADIGEELGCGACLSELRRTAVHNLVITEAVTLDDAMKMTPEQLLARIIPLHKFAGRMQGPR